MLSVWKKKILIKVRFLLILLFSFICGHLINEGLRIYDLLTTKTESCLDICMEDNCSLETKILSIEEAEEHTIDNLFKPVIIEFFISNEAIFSASYVHDVYLGLNTPPPEQTGLFV